MLLDNCGDGNRKSPATDHPTPEQKILHCNFAEREFFFPAGVLGFANCHRYRLARFCPADGSKSPFFTLRSVDQSLEFPLIHPGSLYLDYRFHASPEVLAALAQYGQGCESDQFIRCDRALLRQALRRSQRLLRPPWDSIQRGALRQRHGKPRERHPFFSPDESYRCFAYYRSEDDPFLDYP